MSRFRAGMRSSRLIILPFLPSKIQHFAAGAGWNLGSTGMMLQQGCLEGCLVFFLHIKSANLGKTGKALGTKREHNN